jgi:hypothetical protein
MRGLWPFQKRYGNCVLDSSKVGRRPADSLGGGIMLWTIFVMLLILWLLGMVSSYTLGGFIHILLILALVALVYQLITGRRVV